MEKKATTKAPKRGPQELKKSLRAEAQRQMPRAEAQRRIDKTNAKDGFYTPFMLLTSYGLPFNYIHTLYTHAVNTFDSTEECKCS